MAAGFLSGARVYADESATDPFHALPKKLRNIALAKYGIDFDDDASHLRAAVDLTHVGSDHRRRFLQNRETIMEVVAKTLWPNDPPKMHRSKVKQLFSAKDMRGSTIVWCNKHGVKDPNEVLDIFVNTEGWNHLPPFSVKITFKP